MELIIEKVNLASLCVETVQQLEGQAKTKEGQVKLVADVPKDVAAVETDSAKLKQVIINLVGNALKFTHEGSVTVRLELAPDGRTPVAIAVVDTGIGIPQDRLEAIFEAFQQADAGTSRKYGGTGLGLALSRSICLLMGYDLIVESEVGKGSTFKIVMGQRAGRPVRELEVDDDARVPQAPKRAGTSAAAKRVAAKGPTAAPSAGAVASGAGAPRREMRDFKVLVIDDEKDSRVLITHYLEEFGCTVVSAGNGEQGLALALEHRPDLITLDLIMPGVTGWEVLKRIKAAPELRRIPVVVVSVLAGEGRGSLLGAVDLVTKPFEREDLLRVLWRHLGRSRAGRVLVVTELPDLRARLTTFLSDRGLEVAAPREGMTLVDAVDAEAPDALLLDLQDGPDDRLEVLERLRANRLYAGLPTFVLAEPHLDEPMQEKLRDLFAVVVPRGDPVSALEELLGVLFPIANPTGP
jgi:CheY-like chemotaxis protein